MQKKIRSVQGLRGFAILLIFCGHINNYSVNYAAKVPFFPGAWGCSIFIMLSGCLSYLKYFEKRRINLCGAFKARIFKYWPIHMLMLVISFPLSIKQINLENVLIVVLNVMLLQSWIPNIKYYYSLNAVSWYLSTTILFVFITPFMYNLWKGTRNISCVIIKFFLILICEIVIAFLDELLGFNEWLAYICPLTRVLDFAAGGYRISYSIYKNKYNIQKQTNKNESIFCNKYTSYYGCCLEY